MKKLFTGFIILIIILYNNSAFCQEVFEGSSFPVVKINRTSSLSGGSFNNLDGIASGLLINSETSTGMIDGFGGGLLFGINDDGLHSLNNIARIYARRDGADNKGMLQFCTGTNGTDIRLSIREDGDLGIGTTDPRGKLDVQGGDIWLLESGTQTNGEAIYTPGLMYIIPHSSSNISYLQARRSDNSGSTEMQLRTWNNGNNVNALRINSQGDVGIGTTTPESKLAVDGTITTKEIKVKSTIQGADFVFEESYNLPALNEIESYIKTHKHLPEIPSAKEMQTEGLDLGEMNILLLQKIEELTLHLIAQEKQLNILQQENAQNKAAYQEILKKLE